MLHNVRPSVGIPETFHPPDDKGQPIIICSRKNEVPSLPGHHLAPSGNERRPGEDTWSGLTGRWILLRIEKMAHSIKYHAVCLHAA